MKTKIILVGPAGSGKTTIKNKLIEEGFIPEISSTSRTKRDNEVEGRDYHFVSREDFEQKIRIGGFVQYGENGGHYYGTSVEEFNKCNLFIMTPKAINTLEKVLEPEEYDKLFIVYLDISLNAVYARMKVRGDTNDQILKRMLDDDKLFYHYAQYGTYNYHLDTSSIDIDTSVENIMSAYSYRNSNN